MVAIFMAPISAGFKINYKQQFTLRVEINEARAQTELDLGCTSFTSISLSACTAQLTYIIWSVSAAIARVAGEFLDFFVYYSTNSSSYTNDFVKQGWGAVRDVANIFFIIALLYVAIKTILGLNVTDNKKLISAVIIVALVINFSLFTTKLVIDGSNILAKVFYNNITSKDASAPKVNGELQDSEAGVGGQKTISVGLVDKFNPVELITQPVYDANAYTFIFMTLIIAAILLYMTYIFFSVALLFVGRVVSLWISMIFSPIAFISYSVPFDIPGFGHKEWWKNLIENAMLAPLFIFFLYIIVLFTKFLTDIISYADNPNLTGMENIMQHLMSVIIPFAIIFMLLTMAKKLAVEYSGKMGKAITSIGAMAGGLALGAATGGAALAGRVALGGGGGYLASQAAKGAERLGLKRTASVFKDVGKFTQKSSWDIRQTGAGKAFQKQTGINLGRGFLVGGIGSTENLKGGWTEMKKQQVERRQKRADELEKRGIGKEKDEVADAEIKLKEATLPVKLDLAQVDKEIDKARIDLKEAKNANDIVAMATAKASLDAAKARKETIRDAGSLASGGSGSIKDFEKDVREAKQRLDVKSDQITTAYAKKISGNTSKTLNQIFKLGAYSRAGADEAARKIRTGTKLDSGEKPH